METSGVYFGFLKTFLPSVKLENIHIIRHFSQHIGYSELENIRRIDIFVQIPCFPETMPISCINKTINKTQCSVLKTKQSTTLKIGQLIYV